MGATIWPSS